MKDLNRHLSKEVILMISKHLKRYSTAICEKHIKTGMRYHFTPLGRCEREIITSVDEV